MTFRTITFNKNPFSATNFLSKIREKNMNRELNINTIQYLQNTNSKEFNKKLKKELLERNLEDELSKNNINNFNDNINLQKILPLMLTYNNYLPDNNKIEDGKRSSNDVECSNIISCFQLLLRYLFITKENIKKNNYLLKENLSKLKSFEDLLNDKEIIPKNKEKISELEKKKLKLQIFLKSNGVDIESKKKTKFYVCDICPFPYKQFYNYQDFHQHYVKNHINPYLALSNDYSIVNRGFDKYHFDNKMNELNKEITDMFQRAKSQKKEIIDKDFKIIENNIKFVTRDKNISGIRTNKRYETVGPSMNNKNMHLNNINSLSFSKNKEKRNEFIRKRIEDIQSNQKNFESNFQDQIELFMKEFKNEMLNMNLSKINK